MHPFDGKTKHFFIPVFQKGKVQIPFDAAKPSSSQALDRNFPQRGFPSTARPSNLHPPSYVRDGSQGGISSFGRSVHKFDLKKKTSSRVWTSSIRIRHRWHTRRGYGVLGAVSVSF